MRGSIKNQTKTLSLNIFQKGMSKELQRETGKLANMGDKKGTINTYREVWNEFGNYVKNEHRVRDLQKINKEYVFKYLNMKLETGISNRRMQIISAAMGKLELALKIEAEKSDKLNIEQYKQYNWEKERKSIIVQARKDGIITTKKNYTRAYTDVWKMNENIKKYEHKLASKIQIESGTRLQTVTRGIRETIRINPIKMGYNNINIKEITLGVYPQLCGIVKDTFTKEMVGQILTLEKGGKPGIVNVKLDTYEELENYINKNKVFRINENSYRNELKKAAKISRQEYQGTHGQRWNFARNRMESLQRNGMGFEAAQQQVSWEMKHFRATTTEHYQQ